MVAAYESVVALQEHVGLLLISSTAHQTNVFMYTEKMQSLGHL